MNRMRRDTRELRRLIESDGLPYPMRFDEPDPQPHDIVNIARSVSFNIGDYIDEMDDDVEGLDNFTGIGDFCFDEHEYAYKPRKYIVYEGDTPRPTRRPLRNFLRTVLHIQRFKSDEELEEEARAIGEVLARYPHRVIKIINMNSLFAYFATIPGITVGPSEVMPFLKVDKVVAKYRSYVSSRKYFTKSLTERGKDVMKMLKKCEESNKEVIDILEKTSERMETVVSLNVKNRMKTKALKRVYQKSKSRLESFMISYWQFKLNNDDCFHYLNDFLKAHIMDFCKLNPQKQPKHKCRETPQ